MSSSSSNTIDLERQLLALQDEVELLRKKNTDLDERLKAYSLISSGQTSLINKLIDKVPFGVMLINEEHIITHANDAAGKIFSMDTAQLDGLNSNDFFKYPEFSHDEISRKQITRLNNGKYVMHSAFISDEGSQKIIVESFIDISEIKHAEQELIKVSQTKDEFLGMISHELRTPLNVIQGYSSLLEEEVRNINSTDAVLYVEHINRAGQMLLKVVSNLLELSDLTAGKVKADIIPFDLEMIVTQLQYRLEEDVAAEGNKLVFKYDDIPAFEQDLALLMKILYELLSNANKFTAAGEIIVSISLQNKDGADWLRFEVSDTGCGMTEKTIKQIFDAFHQADSSLTRAYEGLGLGLSLVEKIVKIINGVIEVESEIDKGSTFVISVPYQVVSTI